MQVARRRSELNSKEAEAHVLVEPLGRIHGLRNVGATRFRNVIVEIKGQPANFAAR